MNYFEDKQDKIYMKWMILVILLATVDRENVCITHQDYFLKFWR